MSQASQIFKAVFAAYSNIFFLDDPRLGLLIAVLTFAEPNVALGGIIGLSSVILFSRVVTGLWSKESFDFYLCNSLLVGLITGCIFRVDALGILSIAAFSLATYGFSVFLNAFFRNYHIPILSLPFSIIVMIVFAVSSRYTNLFHIENYVSNGEIPWDRFAHLFYFAKNLGTIIAVPSSIVGICLCAVIGFRSRLSLAYAFLGFFEGVLLEYLFTDSAGQTLHLSYAFNDALVSLALGAFFLIPSVATFLVISVSVAATVFLGDAFDVLLRPYHIPVFTLPFCFATTTTVFLLRTLRFRYLVQRWEGSAEKTFERHLSSTERFHLDKVQISVPFTGLWRVSQGQYGSYTHQPPWQFAIDFVADDGTGKTFKNSGKVLEDYFAFHRPVLSPVTGYVTELVQNLPDLPAGAVDNAHPWGNYIILKTLDGFFVEMSHLMKDSIAVKKGDYVTEGSLLGRVGNSGYSPQPHIHLQVQTAGYVGAPSIPFRFVSFIQGSTVLFSKVPKQDEVIEAFSSDPFVDQALSFILSSEYALTPVSFERKEQETKLVVQMEPESGLFFLCDSQGNKLYFSKNRSYFCFFDYVGNPFSPLKFLYAAAPRIPLIHRSHLSWREKLPTSLSYSRYVQWLVQSTMVVYRRLIRKGNFEYTSVPNKIWGTSYFNGKRFSTTVVFDPVYGITEFSVGSHRWKCEKKKPELPPAPLVGRVVELG